MPGEDATSKALMDGRKRIALYVGTFDPVHLGHLEIAKRVVALFQVDELFFVPAQRAPHKLERAVTPAIHRYAMLALATQEQPRLMISTFELEAPGGQYTVDTLAHFRLRWGDRAKIFFLMGADSWSEITSWREWERLVTTANQIIVTRPGYDVGIAHIPPAIARRVVDLRGADSLRVSRELDETDERIFLTDIAMIDVSATEIRRAACQSRKQDLEKFVSPAVADYILKYKIYKNLNEA